MLRSLLLLSGLYILTACSSQSTETPKSALNKDVSQLNKITLSYVQAYLLIGNIPKAEEHFQTLEKPELMPDAMLALAELRAAKGDDIGAQQAFLLSITHPPGNNQQAPPELLNYFCKGKHWKTLQAYAEGLTNNEFTVTARNSQLSTIGLCFFSEQRWQDASDWLNQLDLSQQVKPLAYLALARINVEQKQYKNAQQFIDKFEAAKTKVDAQILWTSFEVYSALQKQPLAEQAAQHLIELFPSSDYTLITQTMTAFKKNDSDVKIKKPLILPQEQKTEAKIHVIKKGETLYQLSKRYDVSVADLLKWNPTLVVDDISLGTAIQVSEP